MQASTWPPTLHAWLMWLSHAMFHFMLCSVAAVHCRTGWMQAHQLAAHEVASDVHSVLHLSRGCQILPAGADSDCWAALTGTIGAVQYLHSQ